MDKNTRRTRFRALLDGAPYKGDRAALMRDTGLSKGRVAQLLDDKQPFGEKAAQALVEKLGLPAGYFDEAGEPVRGSTDEPEQAQIPERPTSLSRDEFLAICANLSTPDWQLTVRLMVAAGILPGVVEVAQEWHSKTRDAEDSGSPIVRSEVLPTEETPSVPRVGRR